MRAVRYVILSSLLAAVGCGGVEDSQDPSELSSQSPAELQGAAGTCGITSHAGPVLKGTVNLYLIWYGNWTGNTATTILTDFATNSTSLYANTLAAYVGSPFAFHYSGSATVAYPYGTALSDAQIQQVVASTVSSGVLPKDTNAIYFVLTSQDVTASSGFCTQYCGFHTNSTISGSDLKYAFIGNPARCPAACAPQTAVSPNGNIGADGMAFNMGVQMANTVTDPDHNAWYDGCLGAEVADKCAWTFGTAYTTSNGAKANIKLGTRDYYLQQIFNKTGFCSL
jgi:hypothetical protein